MTQSAVNDGSVIVGSISLAASGAAGATARNQSAEEVILITESAQAPGNARSINWNWNGARRPRSALLLDRFSVDCTITHCTNAAILDPETCVNHPGGIYRYVAQRDEEAVRGFIAELKRHGIGAGHGIFSYLDFTMCTTGRDLRTPSRNGTPPRQDEVSVSVVGSATSDGLILVVRRNN
ncbi:tRNA (adenine-N(1)-)-methyltransferase catalytic subunit trm61 [Ceratobasidium sp. 395]|nr:tRNA (adenine-N(1)-)-methyltransferase catalytic subunit trm61 [Ceratobasidium sp. 395]